MGAGKKVAVIGLDGVPFSLLEHLFDSGVMPNLASIAGHGTFVKMETTLPAVSSVAWTSFMTGTTPGEHGIFGFTDLKNSEISLRFPSFDDILQPVIWHMAHNADSVVVNVPFTYPARPLRGTIISGFVAPILERSVYPPSLIDWLKSKNYRTDVDAVKGRRDQGALVKDLFETMNLHEDVMLTLLSRKPWDLFIGVITGTDRLHHFFYDASDCPSHPLHGDFIDYYRRIDAFFGRLQETISAGTRLIILSDHGFTHLKIHVQLNNILKILGYLSFSRSDPQALEDIDPSSFAFALDPTRIYVNSGHRFENGRLTALSAEEVRARLKSDLESLHVSDLGIRESDPTLEQGPLFQRVLLQEEVYPGTCLHTAPDLIVVPRRGYDVKAAVNASEPIGTDIFTGMHTHDDAFLIVDDASYSDRLSKVRISDVAALVLSALDD